MNTQNLPHAPLLRTLLLGGAFALATLLVAQAALAQVILDRREAETLTLSGGANVSDNGQNVWLDANGATATWVDGGAARGDTVVASIAGSTTNATRVVITLRVNGVSAGTKIVPVGANAFAGYSWTGLSLADSDDLALVASEVGTNERVYLDKVRVESPDPDGDGVPDSSDNCDNVSNPSQADLDSDGQGDACDNQDNRDPDSDGVQNFEDQCPDEAGPASNNGCPVSQPENPYPNPTSTSQTFGQRWAPAAGSVHVNPRVSCTGGDPISVNNGSGIRIVNDNVTLVNPQVRNCWLGITTDKSTSGLKVLGDSRAAGGNALLQHNRVSLDVRSCNGCEFKDVNEDGVDAGGSFLIRDTFRIMESEASSNTVFSNIDARCKKPVNNVWGEGGAPDGGCHAGFKWLVELDAGPPYFVLDNVVRDSYISGVDDESIGMDGRYDVDGKQALLGTDTVSARSAANDTITLASSGWGTTNTANMGITIAHGPHQGEYFRILSKSGSTFTVADPQNLIAGMQTGASQKVSVGYVHDGNRFISNTIDNRASEGGAGKVHIDTHGVGNHTKIRDNTLLGANAYPYGTNFHYRHLLDGSVAPQCIDVRTWIKNSAIVGSGPIIGTSAKNSITGNYCESGDISLTVVGPSVPSGLVVQNYWANNTIGQAQIVTYFNANMAADPN